MRKISSIDILVTEYEAVCNFSEHFKYQINPRICLSMLHKLPIYGLSENIYEFEPMLENYSRMHNKTESEQRIVFMCKLALQYLYDVQTMLINVSNHICVNKGFKPRFDPESAVYRFNNCNYFFNLFSMVSLESFKHNSLPEYVEFNILPLIECCDKKCVPFPLHYDAEQHDYTLLKEFALQNMKFVDGTYIQFEEHYVQDIINYVAHVCNDKSIEMQTYIRTMFRDDFELFTKYSLHQFCAKFYLNMNDIYKRFNTVTLVFALFVLFMRDYMLTECIRLSSNMNEDMTFSTKFTQLFNKYKDFWVRCMGITYDDNTDEYIIPNANYEIFTKILHDSYGFTKSYTVCEDDD